MLQTLPGIVFECDQTELAVERAVATSIGLLALDPAVPIAIGVLLMAAAALGAWNPSRHAARADPIVTLRR